MRYFPVEDAPIRILAEGVADGPALRWDAERCLTEEQLLATSGGRAALEAWHRGDDSVYEVFELANLTLSEADDELIRAGLEARSDLRAPLRDAESGEEIAERDPGGRAFGGLAAACQRRKSASAARAAFSES